MRAREEFDYVDRFTARLGVVGFFLLVFFLAGCGADPFVASKIDATDAQPLPDTGMLDGNVENDGGSKDDVSIDASIDSPTADSPPADTSSDACTTMSGVTACNNALDAYCTRHIFCWGSFANVAACRTWFNTNQNRFDCNGMAKYNKQVCKAGADECKIDLSLAPCGVVYNNYPDTCTVACGSFFGQF